ncbi:MAG: hypothetical protein B9S32_00650 [Verrucomicrobia bacterium Tous-C9LFEB]|nr:MAG: hypothetical protein B9S32_00650 [Verrucomicrobia bacterium Tous-C9LFEB]
MSDLIASLLILQDRDQRVTRLTADLEHIPVDEAALAKKLAAQTAHYEQLKAETRKLETDRKKLELDVQTKQALIIKYKGQQQQTRKNEEFAALNHEIERAEQEIVTLEDQELDLMARYDQGLKVTATEEAALKEFQTKVTHAQTELAKKRATLEKELEQSLVARTEAEGKVDELTLRRYRRILASKKDAAIVPIVHGTCTGCHFKLTSTAINNAKSSPELVACDNCGRIIYCPESQG